MGKPITMTTTPPHHHPLVNSSPSSKGWAVSLVTSLKLLQGEVTPGRGCLRELWLGHPLAGVSRSTYSGWCPAGVGTGNRTSLESGRHTPEPQLLPLYEKVAECCCFLGPKEVCACLPGDPTHREEDMASPPGAGVPTPGFTPGREETGGPGRALSGTELESPWQTRPFPAPRLCLPCPGSPYPRSRKQRKEGKCRHFPGRSGSSQKLPEISRLVYQHNGEACYDAPITWI